MDKRSHMVQRLQVTGEKLRMSQQSESAAILQEKHMTLLEQTRDLAYKVRLQELHNSLQTQNRNSVGIVHTSYPQVNRQGHLS